jgi:hypothetical protein
MKQEGKTPPGKNAGESKGDMCGVRVPHALQMDKDGIRHTYASKTWGLDTGAKEPKGGG